jgi:hypothetical protein
LVIKVSTARAERQARGPASGERPAQSVVARSDPRFLGTTIEGDGDAAHGFQGPARGPDDPNGAILSFAPIA